ncbi:hypothetical protein JTB14_002184 [Gonioctena quinquepunctata]|nr:hypothetical protein JTB14_002184 [Gonioctena quinquepunctata]
MKVDKKAYLKNRAEYFEKGKKGPSKEVRTTQMDLDMNNEDEYSSHLPNVGSEDEVSQTTDKFEETEKILEKILKEKISKEEQIPPKIKLTEELEDASEEESTSPEGESVSNRKEIDKRRIPVKRKKHGKIA